MSGILATSAPTPSDPPGHTMGESGAERGGTNALNDATSKPPARHIKTTKTLGPRMFARNGRDTELASSLVEPSAIKGIFGGIVQNLRSRPRGLTYLWPYLSVALPICGLTYLWPYLSVALPICGPTYLWSQAFLGSSEKGTPLVSPGSFGRPSTRSPMMFF